MQQTANADPRRLIHYFLWLIGVMALIAGGATIAFNASLPRLIGFGEAWNFIVVGACLLLYGLFVVHLAHGEPIDVPRVRMTMIVNAVCLVPYVFLVATVWPAQTVIGLVIMIFGAIFLIDGFTFIWIGLRLRRDAVDEDKRTPELAER